MVSPLELKHKPCLCNNGDYCSIRCKFWKVKKQYPLRVFDDRVFFSGTFYLEAQCLLVLISPPGTGWSLSLLATWLDKVEKLLNNRPRKCLNSQTESDNFGGESERLGRAWMQYDSEELDRYLVTDAEDPRINVQSIISRAFLIDTIFPNEFTSLIREELRFGICLSFLLRAVKDSHASRPELLDAIQNESETCGDVIIPVYLRKAYELISCEQQGIDDYISQALIDALNDENLWLPGSAMSTFERIWQRVLSERQEACISVLEPACGSANDYRYLHRFGVSRLVNYTGFDICEKNIANACCRFSDIGFEVADVLDMPYEDKSFDYLFIHDLFEHLSPRALKMALGEIARVTRKQACLSFFNMADIKESIITQSGQYYWNTLSLSRIEEQLMDLARDIDVVGIDSFLQTNYDCSDYHNKEAYTVIVSFDEG